MNGPKKMICGMVCALIILLPMLSGCDSVIDDAKDIIDNLPDPSDIDWTRENPQKLDFNLKDDGTYSVALGSEIYLEKIEIPKTYRGKAVTEIGRFGHEGSPNLYLEEIIIPDSVTTIGERAFEECGSLISIEIPSSVTSIGNKAFYKCVNLLKIVIPDSVTRMGYQAFYGCRNLASVQISQNLSNIEYDSFYGCISLSDIVIPDGVKSIGSGVFSSCENLKSITISDSVTVIHKEAFYECLQLDEVVIPDSVKSFGEGVFARCINLKKITLPLVGRTDGVNNSGLGYLFGGTPPQFLDTVIITDPDGIGADAFYACTNIKRVVLPEGITSIPKGAFYMCRGLTEVVMPDSIKSIGDRAFSGCQSLTEIAIPNSVTSIGEDAFYGCKSLTDIAIPNSVTSIGDYAFAYCQGLTSVVIPENLTSIGIFAFNGCFDLASIMVDSDNTSYKDIDGNLYTKDGRTLIQYAVGKTDASFVIPNGVTSIGNSACYICDSLTSVVIPISVTEIHYSAFSCKNLTSIKYRGSEAKWNAISKNVNWDNKSGKYTITYDYAGE